MAGLHSNSALPVLPEIEGVELRLCRKYIGYAVGSDGSVWSCCPRGGNHRPVPWHQRKVGKDRLGYRSTTIKDYVTGRNGMRGIAPLVCEAFHGPCPSGMECCHNDSRRDNDSADNLRWDTHKNNMQDAVRRKSWKDKPKKLGEANSSSILTAKQVRQIRQLVKDGNMTKTAIAKSFGTSPQNICDIMTGRSWSQLA